MKDNLKTSKTYRYSHEVIASKFALREIIAEEGEENAVMLLMNSGFGSGLAAQIVNQVSKHSMLDRSDQLIQRQFNLIKSRK